MIKIRMFARTVVFTSFCFGLFRSHFAEKDLDQKYIDDLQC